MLLESPRIIHFAGNSGSKYMTCRMNSVEKAKHNAVMGPCKCCAGDGKERLEVLRGQ